MLKYTQIAWQYTTVSPVYKAGGASVVGEADRMFCRVNGVQTLTPAEEIEKGVYKFELNPSEITGLAGDVATVTYQTTVPDVEDMPTSIVNLVDPATLSTSIQYCDVVDVYRRFGSDNVNIWADMNNNRDIDQIAERIIDGIVTASANVNDRLRGRYYAVPFAEPFPVVITDTARLFAGVMIHNARGIEDGDQTIQPAWSEAKQNIRELAVGITKLDLESARYAGG